MRVTPLPSLFLYQNKPRASISVYQPVRTDRFRPSFGKGQTSQQTPQDPAEAARIQAVNELFNGSLESRLEFKQSPKIGDCYFLATIDAFWNNPYGKRIIRDMFSFPSQAPGQEKVYRVTFPELSRSIDVYESEVDGQIIKYPATKGASSHQVTYKPGEFLPTVKTTAKGLKVLEVAYAKYRLNMYRLRLDEASLDPMVELYTGKSYDVMRLLTRWGVLPINKITGNPEQSFRQACQTESAKETLQKIAAHPKACVATAVTIAPSSVQDYYLDPEKRFIRSHYYAVHYIQPVKGEIVLSDPHNNAKKFVISYDEFFKYFQGIAYIDLSKAQN